MDKKIKYIFTSLMIIGTLFLAGCNESNPDKVLSDADKIELNKILVNMDGNIDILFFKSDNECFSCSKTETLMKEIEQLSNKIDLKVYDVDKDKEMAARYDIELVPAIVVIGEDDYGIKHYGFPGGREFNPLFEAMIYSSMSKPQATEDITKKLNTIKNPIEVKIFVTSTCPSCPDMVRIADKYSIVSDKISTVVIMSNEFEDYSKNYKITAVPTTIINESFRKEGLMDEESFINYVVVSS
ncbi:MAG TPA: thioredoxin family protein [Methanofastidiosum sp.]|nr:thioredoxin family protein [Methanofastidiosum sp.]HPA49484.1 thioredoxin family protein [Methanofastidiosum sp.]HQK62654.1 thioredoxin family protein [Methanofastidiosum sp.]HQM94187.1 thioredoxin family protein [Methanofastidiosum sp.]HQQ48807.1 thioredoxin family protein [Methanofastidiosum sp.]